jgi:hypothetical protein
VGHRVPFMSLAPSSVSLTRPLRITRQQPPAVFFGSAPVIRTVLFSPRSGTAYSGVILRGMAVETATTSIRLAAEPLIT